MPRSSIHSPDASFRIRRTIASAELCLRAESFDFVAAAAELDRALALAPGSAMVQRLVAIYTGLFGHFEPALIAAQRAVSLDPQNSLSYRNQAVTLYNARRYGEALVALQHALALNPGSSDLNIWLSEILIASGQGAQARQRCETPTTPLTERDRLWCLALAYHLLGRQADAEHQLEQFKTLDGDAAPYFVAEIYAQWGNPVSALQWLAKQNDSPILSWIVLRPSRY
jgi:tetratricopeptide (TPR) repeat protein